MASENQKRIVVCGHICLDIIPTFPPVQERQDYFRPGRLSIVDAAVTATGGTVSNVGLSLHKLGLPVRLAAKVGNDPFGDIVTASISRTAADLARGIVAAEGEVTLYSVVINPPGVDRIFFHCPGANDTFTDADVPDAVLRGRLDLSISDTRPSWKASGPTGGSVSCGFSFGLGPRGQSRRWT